MDYAEHIQHVRHWADLNTDGLLESSCQVFTTPGIEGFIGYRVESGCAVVFGEPVSNEQDKIALANAFAAYCHIQKLQLIYTMVSLGFVTLMKDQGCPIAIQFGTRLIFDLSIDPLERHGSKAVLVRKKRKHAINDGVIVSEYLGDDPEVEKIVIEMGDRWLQARHGAQIYLAHLKIFEEREGKRWFIARQGEQIVGSVMLHELKASKGWLMNALLTASNAPHGTSEFLVVSAFKQLHQEGYQHVIVGPVVSHSLRHISGLGNILNYMARFLFWMARRIFHLEGQTVFWEKFEPQEEPSYVLFQTFGLKSIMGLFRSFNV